MLFITMAGNLGADPEERFTASGKKVVGLRVAVRIKQNETVWVKANIWGDRFDNMLRYLKKGSYVILAGELGKPEAYMSKDGKPQASISMNVEMIKFGGGSQKEDRLDGASNSDSAMSGASLAMDESDFGMDSDIIPF